MSGSQYIPGPWSYGQESVDPEWWIVTIKGGLIVANVNAHFHQEANACLIAAAPDLLESLKAMTEVAEGQGAKWRAKCPDGNSPLGLAHAAIAKAEGRTLSHPNQTESK